MSALYRSIAGLLFTGWGVFLVSVLDASVFFFLPFGNDVLFVYVVARKRDLFWLYPLIATAGSILGGALTYWVGVKAGETGLPRLVRRDRLDKLKARVRTAGAFAVAIPAALPPPFPLSPFLLTCGALRVEPRRLLLVFAAARLLRFGIEALLARLYGERVVAFLQSDALRVIVAAIVALAIAFTAFSAVAFWRRARPVSQAAG